MMICTLCHGEMITPSQYRWHGNPPQTYEIIYGDEMVMPCPRCHGSGLVPTPEEAARQELHDRALQAAFARD